jgi:hypothetical protein
MKLIVALTAFALLTAPSFAGAPCRDAKGKFTKCPPAVSTAALGGKVSAPDKTGHCRVLVPIPGSKQKKGQFAACAK